MEELAERKGKGRKNELSLSWCDTLNVIFIPFAKDPILVFHFLIAFPEDQGMRERKDREKEKEKREKRERMFFP